MDRAFGACQIEVLTSGTEAVLREVEGGAPRLPTRPRTDAKVLAHDEDMALLEAISVGRVVRGKGNDTSILAPRLLDGRPVWLWLCARRRGSGEHPDDGSRSVLVADHLVP